ncbi:OprD family porin [Pseudomonas sp. CNPSo 3701]|uniref:OprD family porin n=1 Tax=Pseudomonas sp. CNPSo 3701 TaxID=3027943 RepID=UPI0023648AD7|nr:OprD family porin [Pseudomonas sp. CNPSo 3701]MDD1508689.1 OprD family porin [Pseudomonas sp. CNPSo 3701]
MTRKNLFYVSVAPAAVLASLPLAVSDALAEGFFEDSKANLELRNFYLNRDFREGRGQNKREEWAQGFILNMESGYTSGTVGFGLDALAMLGVKLDSSPDRTGTALLPSDSKGRPEDDYSKLGVTAKVRVADSVLKAGTLLPKMPTLQFSNSRLLPQTFEGWQVQSKDIERLTASFGQISRVVQRDVSGSADLMLNNKNGRFGGSPSSDHLRFVGLDYALTPNTQLSYHQGQLTDIYRQHFLGLQHTLAIGPGKLKADLRYFNNSESGQARAGDIDNQVYNAMFTYSLAGHALGVGYQQMRGDDGFTYVNGATPYLTNFLQLNDFAGPDERSWQVRYDYDFSKVGIPGLTLMTRYVRGSGIDLTDGSNGKEWERNTDLAYAFSEGALKNLKITWRNAVYRNNFAPRGMDENRLILSYVLPIW